MAREEQIIRLICRWLRTLQSVRKVKKSKLERTMPRVVYPEDAPHVEKDQKVLSGETGQVAWRYQERGGDAHLASVKSQRSWNEH